jgi:hypothetical protein
MLDIASERERERERMHIDVIPCFSLVVGLIVGPSNQRNELVDRGVVLCIRIHLCRGVVAHVL